MRAVAMTAINKLEHKTSFSGSGMLYPPRNVCFSALLNGLLDWGYAIAVTRSHVNLAGKEKEWK